MARAQPAAPAGARASEPASQPREERRHRASRPCVRDSRGSAHCLRAARLPAGGRARARPGGRLGWEEEGLRGSGPVARWCGTAQGHFRGGSRSHLSRCSGRQETVFAKKHCSCVEWESALPPALMRGPGSDHDDPRLTAMVPGREAEAGAISHSLYISLAHPGAPRWVSGRQAISEYVIEFRPSLTAFRPLPW